MNHEHYTLALENFKQACLELAFAAHNAFELPTDFEPGTMAGFEAECVTTLQSEIAQADWAKLCAGYGYNGTGDCPECGSHRIESKTRTYPNSPDEYDYKCEKCGEVWHD